MMGKTGYRTLRENVTDAIRMKIISQELKPGDRIIEAEMAKEFEASRGPIREALRQLENEGLIEYTRNVGCSVKTITIEDTYEIYLMKTGYETMAVKLLDGKVPAETIGRMETVLERMKGLDAEHYEAVFLCDNEFHGELVRMVNMPRLYHAWNQLSYGNILTGYGQDLDRGVVASRQHLLHKEIMDACYTGETHVICRAISEHYMKTLDWLMKEQGSENMFSWDFLL
ncbi:MAG: GntR family transcriptional regulator [Clostridiales bacterium]|nr:GntR family transcriptional regulator [Clostridiales bacterium]